MKKFNSRGDEQSRLEYWEARCTTKREMAKEKRYVRMDTVERGGVGSPQPRSRHVQRREKGSGQRTSKIEQPARTKRRRPQRRFLDVAMEEIRRVGVGEEDAMDRVR